MYWTSNSRGEIFNPLGKLHVAYGGDSTGAARLTARLNAELKEGAPQIWQPGVKAVKEWSE